MEFWNFARLFWSWCPKLFGREGEGFAPGQRSTFKQFLPNKGEGGQKFYILQLSSIWRKKVFGVKRGNKFVITAKRRRRDKTKSSQNQVSKMRQSKGVGVKKSSSWFKRNLTCDPREIEYMIQEKSWCGVSDAPERNSKQSWLAPGGQQRKLSYPENFDLGLSEEYMCSILPFWP